MSQIFVDSFTHLADRPRAAEALATLQRVASLVKPIMRSHGWQLPVLAEFFPESPNLVGLNVNGGEQILLRLRPAWAPDTFYAEEDIIHTMLHELTHNVHGPHDAAFYAFLSSLESEYDALQRSGYAGEGFFTRGQRLGGSARGDVPPHLARQKALAAAERRQRAGLMLSGGGRRLGGAPPVTGSLRERTAKVGAPGSSGSPLGAVLRIFGRKAAERRGRDDTACGHEGGGGAAQREAARAKREGTQTQAPVIDLTGDDDGDVDMDAGAYAPPAAGPSTVRAASKGKLKKPTPPSLGPGALHARPPVPPPASPPPPAPPTAPDWSCAACTLMNNWRAPACSACDTPRHLSLLGPPPPLAPRPAAFPPGPPPPLAPRPPASAPAAVSAMTAAAARPRGPAPALPQTGRPPVRLAPDWACPGCTLQNVWRAPACSACGTARPRTRVAPSASASAVGGGAHGGGGGAGEGGGEEWVCGVCTLANPPGARRCEMCDAPRPVPVPVRAGPGWTCGTCAESAIGEAERWCTFCGAGRVLEV